MNNSRAGFTLIELLVVIGILGLLAAAILPDIFGAKVAGNKAADKANLKWHFEQYTHYQAKYKRMPTKSGHKFVLSPWVERVTERTLENMGRYFTPGLDPAQKTVLIDEGIENIWKDFNAVSSDDTDYAGRNRKIKGKLISGKEPLMANDNEYMSAFNDHTIHVLLGSGNVRELLGLDLEKDYGFDLDGEDVFEVGPASPHPLLQKLMK